MGRYQDGLRAEAMADDEGWIQVLASDQSDQLRLDTRRQESGLWLLGRCGVGYLPQPHGWRIVEGVEHVGPDDVECNREPISRRVDRRVEVS